MLPKSKRNATAQSARAVLYARVSSKEQDVEGFRGERDNGTGASERAPGWIQHKRAEAVQVTVGYARFPILPGIPHC